MDDCPAIRAVIGFALETAGISAVIAASGTEALNYASQQYFNLVVTDEQMPEMSGQEFCQRLRKNNKYAKTPIIFLTAKQLELELEHLSVATILGKPLSPRELADVVSDALGAEQTSCS